MQQGVATIGNQAKLASAGVAEFANRAAATTAAVAAINAAAAAAAIAARTG